MESGYDGLTAVQKSLGDKIKVQMIENISNADMEQALTTLAQKNQLVIGIGGQTQAALTKVAKKFPKIKFAVIGGNRDETVPNMSGYDVKQAQIAYVVGAAAAMVSKTGVISYVGGLEIPPIVNTGTEYGNGAKSVNPKIKVIVNYTGASPINAIEALIASARNGGAWTGNGVISSNARIADPKNLGIGAIEATDYFTVYGAGAQFADQTIDDTAVLLKTTYYGDTDFNGIVNFDDYSRTDAGFNSSRTGWFNGDFDMNDSVNFDDYSLIDLAFNTQVI